MIGKLRILMFITLLSVAGVGMITSSCSKGVTEDQMQALEELRASVESLNRQIRDCEQEKARLEGDINQKKDELAAIQRDLDAMESR